MPSTYGGEWAEKPLRGQQTWTPEKHRRFDRQERMQPDCNQERVTD